MKDFTIEVPPKPGCEPTPDHVTGEQFKIDHGVLVIYGQSFIHPVGLTGIVALPNLIMAYAPGQWLTVRQD